MTIGVNRPYLGGTVPLFNAKNLTVPPFLDSVPLFQCPQRCYLSLNDHKLAILTLFSPSPLNSGEIFSNVPLLTEKIPILVDFVPLFSFNRLTPML